ncbi:MAG TPA: ACP S-malonyltransferase [Nitrolancea sp.]|nr:ACP S-malonyltransferase [Nitrolancea sp.]
MPAAAWIFPGQGSQRVGMGQALAESEPAAREVYERVDDALGFKLSDIIFSGPDEELVATRNQQPALLATSIAYLEVLKRRGQVPEPQLVAGHSLGEYSALVASGALDLADGARLVRKRGELMEQHGLGGMIAVLGLDDLVVNEIATLSGAEVANINAPGQITLSGRSDALERATQLAREAGARRVIPLAVNVAFHCSLMAPVVAELQPMIAEIPFKRPAVPLIANVDARLLSEPDDLRAELAAQITASVRWVDVIQRAMEHGVTSLFEIGPGKVLSGLATRIGRDLETAHAEAFLHD